MINYLKAHTALPATVVMILSLLVACTQNEGSTSSDGNTEELKDSMSAKVTWYAPTHALNKKLVKSFDELIGFQEIQKSTGMDIEFLEPAAGDVNQQFNILLSSGSYPDIISWNLNNYPGGLQKLLDDGVAIDLSDLIDQHAPNYKKILQENPEIRKQVQLDDGRIVQFTKIELDVRRLSYDGFLIRNDWLTKLGLKRPETVDELYEVLKAFKEKDPNGNGQADEIPLGDTKNANGIKALATAFGIRSEFFLRDGQMAFGPLQPEYRAYMETLAKWYKEGLIENEFPSLDQNAFDAKYTNHKYGLVYGNTQYFWKYESAMKDNTPDYKAVPMINPKGSSGKSYSNNNAMVNFVDGPSTFITSQNKDPVASVKLIDFMYGEEGGSLLSWGIEGDSYTIKDGKKQFTDKVMKNTEGYSPADYIKKWGIPSNAWTKIMDREAWSQLELNTPEAAEANVLWAESDTSLLTPLVTLNTSESQKFSNIMSEVNTYLSEMTLKFIMGVEPMNKYDDFVAQLKKMGIEEAVKIQQTAYERFKMRK